MDTHHHQPHTHAAGLDACIDLINTLELDGSDGVPEDHRPAVDDVLAFLVEHGLGHDADLRRQAGREGEAWLMRFRATRAALRELWDAQVEARTPDAGALATLNGILDRGPRVELRAAPGGVAVAHRHPDDDPTGEALARAALPLVDAIAAGDTARLRVCDNDACRWVFEDASRAGRRRWCDMSTCGNRAKVRRYRSRRRDGDAPAEAPTPPGGAPA